MAWSSRDLSRLVPPFSHDGHYHGTPLQPGETQRRFWEMGGGELKMNGGKTKNSKAVRDERPFVGYCKKPRSGTLLSCTGDKDF